MVTRYYFSNAGAAPVSPSFTLGGTAWADTASALRRALLTAKAGGESLVDQTVTVTTSSVPATRSYLFRQNVGPQIGAQTLSGTLGGLILGTSNPLGGSGWATYAMLKVYVVSGDGSTLRGILYDATEGGADYFAARNARRITVSTYSPGNAFTSLAVLNGDRIVVEIGANFHDIISVHSTDVMQEFGAPSALGDFTAENTDGLVGWIEFSGTISPYVAPPPDVDSVSPTHGPSGSPNTPITVTGTDFVTGAIVRFGGTNLTTVFVSSTSLTATILAAQLTTPGTFAISVINPDAQTSDSVNFTVDPPPDVDSVSPNNAPAGSPNTPITVTGTDFVTGAIVRFAGTNLTTVFVSSTSLTATILAAQLTAEGVFAITVHNPDGQVSDSASFAVGLALVSLDPPSITAGAGDFVLTLHGAGFAAGAVAVFGGTDLTTTFVNSTTLTALVTAAMVASVATHAVHARNPDTVVSNSIDFLSVLTSLTLVAGPIFIDNNITPYEHSIAPSPVFQPGRCAWIERLGLLAVGDTGAGVYQDDLFLVQMDGSAIRLGYRGVNDSIGIEPDIQIALGYSAHWTLAHLPTTRPISATHGGSGAIPAQFGIMPDRLITFNALTRRIYSSPAAGGAPTIEFEFPGVTGAGALGLLAYAGPLHGIHRWWCMMPATGQIFLYNATTQQEIRNQRRSFGSPFNLAGYSPKHDLFFVTRQISILGVTYEQLYVYANEVQANALSLPVFDVAPRRGAVSRLSVRLGTVAEPIPGRAISFTVSQGSVDLDVVQTDANGIAATNYQAPFTAPAGSLVVTASLVE